MRKILKTTPIVLLVALCIAPLINAAALTPELAAPSYSLQRSVSTRIAGPPPSWSKTYGDTGYERFYGIVSCSSGGYALVGHTSSYGAGSYDLYLARVDTDGNLLWNKTIGGTDFDSGRDIIELSDGFAIVGLTESYGMGGYDIWLVKTDLNGNHLWNRTFGSCGYDYGYGLVACADGNFTIAGYKDTGANGNDVWLIHTNSTGHLVWDETYGDTLDDKGFDLVECTGGGYAICGYTKNYGADQSDGWLVRTNSNGVHQWNKTFGGTGYDQCNSIIECSSGGFALTGKTGSYGVDAYAAWLIRTNAAGTHQWNQTYDGFGSDAANALIEYSDGGFAIAGHQQHTYTLVSGTPLRSPQPYDGLLLRADASGNQLWNSTYGASGQYDEDLYNCLLEDSTGAILTGGETEGFGAGNEDGWLVKTRYPLVWDPAPTDQTVPYGLPLAYDVNASSHFSIASWIINDTTQFAINSNGVVSFALPLPAGVYGLRVSVIDVVGSEIYGVFSVTIEAPLISPILPAIIAVVAIIIIVLVLLLLYFFRFRKKK